MQDLKVFIAEKLDISKDYSGYSYKPKDKKELESLLEQLIKERGPEGDFNDIDTSLITDMSYLFYANKTFNGDISRWDTSKVTDVAFMFWGASSFNQPIGRWDTSRVTGMKGMFLEAKNFNQDISTWRVNHVSDFQYIFIDCPIKEQYKPHFK